MPNQTGQEGRHTLPPSLPLPSRTSVPVSRTFACPSSPSSDYCGAVPPLDFIPPLFQEEWLDEEDAEWFDPLCAEFPPEVTPVARDPIFDSVLTGHEAEAMIKKYGGDLFNPVESAPMATAHTASFFCDSVPSDSGLKLHPILFAGLIVLR